MELGWGNRFLCTALRFQTVQSKPECKASPAALRGALGQPWMLRVRAGGQWRVVQGALGRGRATAMASTGPAEEDQGNRSIHSDNIPTIHNVPMRVLIRPIPSVLEESKVTSLMKTIQVTPGLYILGVAALCWRC